MLVLLALQLPGFGKFPKDTETELPGRMTYSGTTSSTCDPFKEDWRYAYVSGAEMNLAGVDYGQKVTRDQCFDACGNAPACKQAVCYSAGVSVWEADTPCHCYPMNTARTQDSDGKGGSNTGFASIHCNVGRRPTTCPPCPTTGTTQRCLSCLQGGWVGENLCRCATT